MHLSLLALHLALSTAAQAEVTVYGVLGSTTVAPLGAYSDSASVSSSTTTSYVTTTDPPQYTGLAAYNPIYYHPPPLPDSPPSSAFSISLPNSASNINGLSIPQKGTFFGFSIEMSVATQLIGKKPSILNVQFLNLMSIIVQKAGAVHVRVGGNTQETAYLVESLEDGRIIEKDKETTSNPTSTPTLAFTSEFIQMLASVSSLVNCKWYLGIPFNDTNNFRFQIAEVAEGVLGDNLLGFQAGNEPDLYGKHQRRLKEDYDQWDYFGEFGLLTQAYMSNSKISTKNNLIAPSIQGGNWGNSPDNRPIGPEPVWDTGFFDSYGQYLNALSVEHYPSDNCAVTFPAPNYQPKNPIDELNNYLTHQKTVEKATPYLNSTTLAQGWGKPFLMFETNTASCGGFPGLSDSFASALWGLDWCLQLAHSNFSGALFHAGGQNVSYNPFTAAPTNESSFHQWTVGPIFYSAIVVAEALGTTNTSQVKDLSANDNNNLTPGYAVYESGNLAKLVLINFMTDPTGAHDYVATVNVGGQQFGEANAVPAQVKVKYLLAPSVSEKDNITWAGQTLGGRFQADGRWEGTEVVQTIACDQSTNTCQIRVPAPGAALVFVSDVAQQKVSAQDPVETFPTTVVTKTVNTVTVDPDAVATSNGHSGKSRGGKLGGTSPGGKNGAPGVRMMKAGVDVSWAVMLSVVFGTLLL